MKLKEYKEVLWGKVFRLKSEEFGVNIFLVSKFPDVTIQSRHKFIRLDTEWAEAYWYTSVMHDEILEVWENIHDWKYNKSKIKNY
jgi:hypothetical protein